MQITVEIPDALAGQLHLGAKADLHTLLRALVEQRVDAGGLTVVQVEKPDSPVPEKTAAAPRPKRDVLGRLRGIYGDVAMTGENAVLVARRLERY